MKKNKIICFLCLNGLLAIAQAVPVSQPNFFLGMMLGVDKVDDYQRLVFNDNKVSNPDRYDSSHHVKGNKPRLALQLGYGQIYKKYYLGGEFDINPLDQTSKLSTDNYRMQIERILQIDGLVRAGYFLKNNVMPYALGGVTFARSIRSVIFTPGGIYNTSRSISALTLENPEKTINELGIKLGLGIELPLMPQLHIRAEYAHDFYFERSANLNDSTYTFNNPYGKYRFRLNNNEISLGVNWLFDLPH